MRLVRLVAGRMPMLIIVLTLILAAGCWRSNPGDVILKIRNLSSQAVTLTIGQSGRTVSHQILAWHEGLCYAGLRLDRGEISLSVTGLGVDAASSYSTTITADAVEPEIGVEVEPDGRVKFDATMPSDTLPCTGGGY